MAVGRAPIRWCDRGKVGTIADRIGLNCDHPYLAAHVARIYIYLTLRITRRYVDTVPD